MDSTPTQGTRVLGAGPELFERAADRLARLRELGAQGGLALPERLAQGPTSEVVVQEQATGVSLAAVMARRGSLPLGECVGMGVRVAHELARMHGEGLVHGALDARAVLVDGHVRLTRLLDGASEAATAHDAPGDIKDLGVLLMECVEPSYASRLGAWVEPMIAEDAALRPSAATVAKALLACAPPAQVTIPVGDVAGGFREAIGHAVRKKAPNPATKAPVRPAAKASVRAAAVPAPLPLESGQQWRRASRRRRLALWAALTVVVLGGLGAAMWRGIAFTQEPDAVGADASSAQQELGASAPARDEGIAVVPAIEEGEEGEEGDDAGDAGDADEAENAEDAENAENAENAEQTEDAVAAARRLTEDRIVAIATGDAERLLSLTVPGLPAHRDALEAASAMRSGELAVPDVSVVIGDTVVLGQGPGPLTWVRIDYEWAPGMGESALLALAHTSGRGWLVAWAADATPLDQAP